MIRSTSRAIGPLFSAEKKKSGTDALVGISVDVVSKHFILWSQTCTEVRTTAVSLP